MINIRKIKPFVLPAAIVLGLTFHHICELFSPVVPWLIFSILVLTFSSTNLLRLKFERLDLYLLLFQTIAPVGLYLALYLPFHSSAIAEGVMMGALCPVASSVTVVAGMLGAKRENTVAYTIFGNLLICILAPLIFVFLTPHHNISFADSFISIFLRIAAVIGFPFFLVLALQRFTPKISDRLSAVSGFSFYLWALALLLTLGQTIDFIFIHGPGHWMEIAILAVSSLIICPLQFYIGRLIGRRQGDAIAGQQLLGQKNSAMGIWMANTYLNPLASTFLAFYSIWQNIINSWQIWKREHQR